MVGLFIIVLAVFVGFFVAPHDPLRQPIDISKSPPDSRLSTRYR
jgi:hypothetical protein